MHNKALKATGNKRFLFSFIRLSPCALVSALCEKLVKKLIDIGMRGGYSNV